MKKGKANTWQLRKQPVKTSSLGAKSSEGTHGCKNNKKSKLTWTRNVDQPFANTSAREGLIHQSGYLHRRPHQLVLQRPPPRSSPAADPPSSSPSSSSAINPQVIQQAGVQRAQTNQRPQSYQTDRRPGTASTLPTPPTPPSPPAPPSPPPPPLHSPSVHASKPYNHTIALSRSPPPIKPSHTKTSSPIRPLIPHRHISPSPSPPPPHHHHHHTDPTTSSTTTTSSSCSAMSMQAGQASAPPHRFFITEADTAANSSAVATATTRGSSGSEQAAGVRDVPVVKVGVGRVGVRVEPGTGVRVEEVVEFGAGTKVGVGVEGSKRVAAAAVCSSPEQGTSTGQVAFSSGIFSSSSEAGTSGTQQQQQQQRIHHHSHLGLNTRGVAKILRRDSKFKLVRKAVSPSVTNPRGPARPSPLVGTPTVPLTSTSLSPAPCPTNVPPDLLLGSSLLKTSPPTFLPPRPDPTASFRGSIPVSNTASSSATRYAVPAQPRSAIPSSSSAMTGHTTPSPPAHVHLNPPPAPSRPSSGKQVTVGIPPSSRTYGSVPPPLGMYSKPRRRTLTLRRPSRGTALVPQQSSSVPSYPNTGPATRPSLPDHSKLLRYPAYLKPKSLTLTLRRTPIKSAAHLGFRASNTSNILPSESRPSKISADPKTPQSSRLKRRSSATPAGVASSHRQLPDGPMRAPVYRKSRSRTLTLVRSPSLESPLLLGGSKAKSPGIKLRSPKFLAPLPSPSLQTHSKLGSRFAWRRPGLKTPTRPLTSLIPGSNGGEDRTRSDGREDPTSSLPPRSTILSPKGAALIARVLKRAKIGDRRRKKVKGRDNLRFTRQGGGTSSVMKGGGGYGRGGGIPGMKGLARVKVMQRVVSRAKRGGPSVLSWKKPSDTSTDVKQSGEMMRTPLTKRPVPCNKAVCEEEKASGRKKRLTLTRVGSATYRHGNKRQVWSQKSSVFSPGVNLAFKTAATRGPRTSRGSVGTPNSGSFKSKRISSGGKSPYAASRYKQSGRRLFTYTRSNSDSPSVPYQSPEGRVMCETPARLAASERVQRSLSIKRGSAASSACVAASTSSSSPASTSRRSLKLCPMFIRFGRCKRQVAGKCQLAHLPATVAVCWRWLRGACTRGSSCLLTHRVEPEKMPVCTYFLQGLCTKGKSCPYLHVNVNPKAPVCQAFLRGYCFDGYNCTKKHTWVCQPYAATGICPNRKICRSHHPKNIRPLDVASRPNMKRKREPIESVHSHGDRLDSEVVQHETPGETSGSMFPSFLKMP